MYLAKGISICVGLVFAAAAFAEPVNVNSEDATTIAQNLSGIGQKKAEAIVEYRKSHGLFKSIDELANVKGVGEKLISKNRDDILIEDEASVQ